VTNADIKRLLSILRASYPRQEIDEATVKAYSHMLADLDYDEARAATQRLIATSKFFPTIAEIRAEVAEESMSAIPSGEEAWGEVRRAISRVGSYRTPTFDIREIAEAVDVIGWRNLCLSDNPASSRARFIDAYRSIRERSQSIAQMGRFAPRGLIDRHEHAQLEVGKRHSRAVAAGELLSGVMPQLNAAPEVDDTDEPDNVIDAESSFGGKS
jgi:hypothetical protein